jgi:hypothetical protein
MTPCLPPTTAARIELERTIQERRESIQAGRAPIDASSRIRAMEEALRLVQICDDATYFETNGNPTSVNFR